MTTEQELNEYLATEIMEVDMDEYGGNSYFSSWNPLINLEQAFECLETYCDDWVIGSSGKDGEIITEVWGDDSLQVSGRMSHTSLSKSIVGAILKAENEYNNYREVFGSDK